jgi:hypothetical protein
LIERPSGGNGSAFKNVTLEMSLKPFKKNDPDYIRGICREVFTQWAALIRHADQVSVMMWTADGSEILDYRGDPNQRLEWAMYLGNPNTAPVGSQPDAPRSIHQRAFLYMENPPEFTYGDLRFIVQCLKEEGRRVTGKPVRVGATFDPGPGVCQVGFQVQRHPEICMGATMGHKSFVCCYAVLHADDVRYAGFPDGIPEGTPFGTFFGRQAQHFLTDLGYDYIWFSNGLGFGLETWSSTGAIFTGKGFNHERLSRDAREDHRLLGTVPRRMPRVPHRDAGHQSGDRDRLGQRRRGPARDLPRRFQSAASAQFALGRVGRRFRTRTDRLLVAHGRTAGRGLPLPLLHP